MRTHELPLREKHVDTAAVLELTHANHTIDARELAQFLQADIHLLIAKDREHLVVRVRLVNIAPQDLLTIIV